MKNFIKGMFTPSNWNKHDWIRQLNLTDLMPVCQGNASLRFDVGVKLDVKFLIDRGILCLFKFIAQFLHIALKSVLLFLFSLALNNL